LTIRIRTPVLGEDVLLAGFSDEMYPPFTFPHRLNPSLEGFPALMAAQKIGFDVELGMLIVKVGMIGSSFGFSFEGKTGVVKGSIFFVDNAMHSGASGDPVVDENGEAIGVITERAITRLASGPAPDLYVPSGATHAMNLEPLTAIGRDAR
jgi:CBS domain-containing protein